MIAGVPGAALAGLALALAADSAAVPDSAGPAPMPLRLRAVAVAAAAPAGKGEAIRPAGVAVDAFGRIYVTDAALHRLLRYDARGARLGEAGALGSGPGAMRRPGAVAILGTLNVAVLDEENRRVLSYDLFGRLEGTLIDLDAPELADRLGRVDPVDLCADRGGAVYVADAERDRILAFDFAGGFVRAVGGYGARPGSFRGLRGIAVGVRGDLVTAERTNARAQRLDPGGRVLASWSLAVRPGPGALPVAVDDSARVAVADEVSGALWVFDGAGRPLAALAGLERPRALAFARDGTLLVAESGGGRVRRYAIEPAAEIPAAGEN